MTIVALIPCRSGSRRISGKNTRLLGGHPLLAYSIAAAQHAGFFNGGIWLSSDDDRALRAGADYGARPIMRPPAYASDTAPDIKWVDHALRAIEQHTARPELFAILRPTSPFRTGATIQRAYRQFMAPDQTADSLRAVEPVRHHPGKMWTWQGAGYPMKPFLDHRHADGTPWHSSPTQSLPRLYVQNSSLEIAWSSCVFRLKTISGRKVIPFFTEGYEGFAIDEPGDFERAEELIASGQAQLPALGGA